MTVDGGIAVNAGFLVGQGARSDLLLAAALGDVALVRRHLDADPACAHAALAHVLDRLLHGVDEAVELAPRGIRVNAVAPGTTDTDLLRSILTPEVEAAIVAQTYYGRRLGQPADIAEVVAFLASAEAEWITGQVINASGGLQI